MEVSTINPPTVHSTGRLIRQDLIAGMDAVLCLSLCQPYASLVVAGIKTIETRKWNPVFRKQPYRGPLLICASKTVTASIHNLPPSIARQLADAVWNRPVRPSDELPTGVALGVVDIVGARPMVASDEAAACCGIYPDAISWMCANAYPIKPFAMKGALGLFVRPVTARQLQRI